MEGGQTIEIAATKPPAIVFGNNHLHYACTASLEAVRRGISG